MQEVYVDVAREEVEARVGIGPEKEELYATEVEPTWKQNQKGGIEGGRDRRDRSQEEYGR